MNEPEDEQPQPTPRPYLEASEILIQEQKASSKAAKESLEDWKEDEAIGELARGWDDERPTV
jgi:hypothetical protein